jgi:succinylglutamate desuccinylase
MLNILEALPENFFEIKSTELYKTFSGPTLIRLKGKTDKPLLLSSLMHGNEFSSLIALQEVLAAYKNKTLPRNLDIFFGNPLAAAKSLRHLPEQPDFNRIWEEGDLPENKMAQAVLKIYKNSPPFLSIDMHNNSGKNPCYSVVSILNSENLNLANLFTPLVMYNAIVRATNTQAFSSLCPSITVEASTPGDPIGIENLISLINKALELTELPKTDPKALNLNIVNTIGTIFVPSKTTIDIKGKNADIVLEPNFENHNFKIAPKGTEIGSYTDPHRLIEKGPLGNELNPGFLEYKNGKIFLNKPMIPGMYTTNPHLMKTNCVCYILDKIDL